MVEELKLVAADGHVLAATRFDPSAGSPRLDAAVVINGATAVLRSYYADFATFLAARGFTVLTYDYRGIGGSRPAPNARMSEWGRLDMAAALEWTAKTLGPARIFGVGHSAGGQLVGLAENRDVLAAFVGVAAQSGYWRHWPAPARYRRALDWNVTIPAVATVLGKLPKAALGQELPKDVAREWATWCRHPNYILLDDAARAAAFASWKGDILAFSFEDDTYAPSASVDGLMKIYPGATKQRRHVTPREVGGAIGHFGFFRKRFEPTLWQEAATWLEARP